MITASQIAKRAQELEPINKNELDELTKYIQEYGKRLCKEQREICAKIKGFGHEMKNASEPKL